MRTPEEVAREIECERSRDECIAHSMDWPCNDSSVRYVAEAIRARDAEVAAQARAEALAGFEREDVAPFHGHGHTEPGYWRLVGLKHYQPLPPPPTVAEVRAIRERFGLEPEP